MADKGKKALEPGKLYKVDVPADMPVKQFWALTVYDRATFSFIYSDTPDNAIVGGYRPKGKAVTRSLQ